MRKRLQTLNSFPEYAGGARTYYVTGVWSMTLDRNQDSSSIGSRGLYGHRWKWEHVESFLFVPIPSIKYQSAEGEREKILGV